jgi:hypothetical protein
VPCLKPYITFQRLGIEPCDLPSFFLNQDSDYRSMASVREGKMEQERLLMANREGDVVAVRALLESGVAVDTVDDWVRLTMPTSASDVATLICSTLLLVRTNATSHCVLMGPLASHGSTPGGRR